MIKFFRRIRQQLIGEGRLGKYLAYAIGEIILVVIGILIALQINSWNSFQKDRAIEREYLERLVEDLKTDTFYHIFIIDLAEEKKRNIEFILPYLTDHSMEIRDTLKFMNALIVSSDLGWNHGRVLTATVDELRSTGNFSLIENTSLRSKIAEYYHFAYDERIRVDKRRGNYPHEIYRLVPRTTDEEGHEFSFRNDFIPSNEIIKSIRKSNLKKCVIAELNLAQFIIIRQRVLLDHSKTLLIEIEKEIDKK